MYVCMYVCVYVCDCPAVCTALSANHPNDDLGGIYLVWMSTSIHLHKSSLGGFVKRAVCMYVYMQPDCPALQCVYVSVCTPET